MGRYTLLVSHPDLGEMSFPVAANGTYHIGSQSGNDIVLPLKDVSRRHAVLKVLDGYCHVTDLKSKNGTFVGGRPADSADFRFGETVRLSSASLVVLEEHAELSPSGPVSPVDGNDVDNATADPTDGHLGTFRVSDVVTLLGEIHGGLATRSLTGPVGWAVRALGAGGAMVLYGDHGGGVSLVASSGDLGGLVSDSAALRHMVERGRGSSSALHQFAEGDHTWLLGTLSQDHVLVIRCGTQIPAVSGLHALMKSLDILLDLPRAYQANGDASARRADAGVLRAGGRLNDALADVERRMIREALSLSEGRRGEAAKRLGVSVASLRRRIHRLGLETGEAT